MLKHLTVAILLAAGAMWAQAPSTPAAKPQSAAPAKKAATTATHAAPKAAAKPVAPLTTLKDKFSYALGMNMGSNLRRGEVEVDPNILQRGLKTALAGGKTELTEQEAMAALQEVSADVRKKMQEKMEQEAVANKKAGDAFLATNKAKDGVVTLPDGLQYKVLTAGTGAKPTAGDTVTCNYRGTLVDGTEFDSSYKRKEPMTFPVAGVIKGWNEALQLMPVGSKWQLFIPAELAYGEHPRESIPPNSTLIFEVELLSIEPKAAEQNPQPAPTPAPAKAPDQAPAPTQAPAASSPAPAGDKK